jgi:ubiquinone/menaquinone biosynthesis C-methylase UbiE
MKRLAKTLNSIPSPTILDVATGAGNFVHIMLDMLDNFDKIIGIDTLERAIESANKTFKQDNVLFEVMMAEDMRYDDETFDVVSFSNSVHHMKTPSKVFKEMERVLKKGGKLIILEMMSDNLDEQQMSHLMVHHFAAEIDREFGEYHAPTMTKDEIIMTINAHSSLMIKDSWNLFYNRKKENTDEEIKWLLETVDRLVGKIQENHKKYTYFKEKAKTIKAYINKHGFDSATTLVVVLEK